MAMTSICAIVLSLEPQFTKCILDNSSREASRVVVLEEDAPHNDSSHQLNLYGGYKL